jgi:hypothetical protein
VRGQIKNLILAGTSKADILKIVGCSEEFVNELLADKDFVDEVKQARLDKIDLETEKEYAHLENLTLQKVKSNLDYYDAGALCKVLETVSRARVSRATQRAQTRENAANHFGNPTVGIAVTVPVFLGNSQVLLDSKKQVVAINGRNMAALPTDQVQALFNSLDSEKEKGNSNDQARTYEDPILADAEARAALATARANASSRESIAA